MDFSSAIVRCRQCGRPLRSQASKERQFGATCALQIAEKWLRQHPRYLSIAARKRVTRKEVKQLARWFMDWQLSKGGVR